MNILYASAKNFLRQLAQLHLICMLLFGIHECGAGLSKSSVQCGVLTVAED